MTISDNQKIGAGVALVLAVGTLHAWLYEGSIGLFLFGLMIVVFAMPLCFVWLFFTIMRRHSR